MPIQIKSKYNYKEICKELGIEYSQFIGLINNKDNPQIKTQNSSLQYSAIYVIDMFLGELNDMGVLKVKSINTIKYYKSFLTRFRSYIETTNKTLLFNDLNEDIFYSFVSTINSTKERPINKKSTINTYISILKKLCTFATEKEYVEKNKGYKFKKNSEFYLPRYLNNDQLSEIFKEASQARNAYLWVTVFITLLGTGLRVHELVKLKLKDIDFEKDLIYTLGKGDKERYIPIYPQVKNVLLNFLKITGVKDFQISKEGFLFSRDFGEKREKSISIRSVQYNFEKILKKLNLDSQFSLHSLRHTYAVNCLKAGIQLVYLCQILGHSSPSTTAIYTKLFPNDLRNEVNDKYPIPFEKLFKKIITGED